MSERDPYAALETLVDMAAGGTLAKVVAERDRLRAQLTRLVEAARPVTNHTHTTGGIPSYAIGRLRAVLDKIENP